MEHSVAWHYTKLGSLNKHWYKILCLGLRKYNIHCQIVLSYHTADTHILIFYFVFEIKKKSVSQLSLTEVGQRDSVATKNHDVCPGRCSSTTFRNFHPQFGPPRMLGTIKLVLGKSVPNQAMVWQSYHTRTFTKVSYHEMCHARCMWAVDIYIYILLYSYYHFTMKLYIYKLLYNLYVMFLWLIW